MSWGYISVSERGKWPDCHLRRCEPVSRWPEISRKWICQTWYRGWSNIPDLKICDTHHCIQTLFIESWCDDYRIIEENVRRVKISSPDVSTVFWASVGSMEYWLSAVCGLDIWGCCQALSGSDIRSNSSVPYHGRKRSQLYQGASFFL